MQQWAEIRRRVLVEGVSRRQILRETGLHWKTLKKILEHSGPPGYRQNQPRPRKKIGPYEERIRQIIKEDKAMPPKQRHTAKRVFERLREEGYVGGYTAVKDAVREMEQKNREVFVPLARGVRVCAVFREACEECSLYEICLPQVTSQPAGLGRAGRRLFET